PVRQALGVVGRLAEIVNYLHRQGVVHGNLKPSNVLLAADGIPRVVDFRPTGGLFQGPPPADDDEPAGGGHLAPEVLPDPAPGRRPPPVHRRLRPGDDPVRTADRPAAVRRAHRAGDAGAGAHAGPRPAFALQPRGDAAPGGVLPSLPAEEPVEALFPRLRPDK